MILSFRDELVVALLASRRLPILAVGAGGDQWSTPPDPLAAALEQSEARRAAHPPGTQGHTDWQRAVVHLQVSADPAAAIDGLKELLNGYRTHETGGRPRRHILEESLLLAMLLRRRGELWLGRQVLDDAIGEANTATSYDMIVLYAAERAFSMIVESSPRHALESLEARTLQQISVDSVVDYARAIAHIAAGEPDRARVAFEAGLARLGRSGRLSEVQERIALVHGRLVLLSANPTQHPDLIIADVEAIMDAIERLGEFVDIHTRNTPLNRLLRHVRRFMLSVLASLPDSSDVTMPALRLTLGVKQTAVAAFIRQRRPGSSGMGLRRRIERTLRSLHDVEANKIGLSPEGLDDAVLGARLEAQISATFDRLARPRDLRDTALRELFGHVAGAHIIEFVGPATTLSSGDWFRLWIRPDGSRHFDRLSKHCLDRVGEIDAAMRVESTKPLALWTDLAGDLLPPELWSELQRERAPASVVISPFGALAHVPWAALRGDDVRCLADVAVIHTVPTLSSLTTPPAFARELATPLVCLNPARALDVSHESTFWTERFGADSGVVVDDERFVRFLRSGESRNPVQVSAHGDGTGLNQAVYLPMRFDAVDALTVQWPSTVLLLSCHVGRPDLDELDMVGMVISCLACGAREVLSGIGQLGDSSTGEIGVTVLRLLYDNPTASMATLLRRAQLEFLGAGWRPVREWALLTCYVDHVAV